MEKLHKLFEPVKIAKVTVKNKIVMSPMGLSFCEEDGTINDRFVEFYSARARGSSPSPKQDVSSLFIVAEG